jgi:HAD superfamily hydrolase (TIGR01484 family)
VTNDGEKNGLPFELGAFDLDGTVLRRDLKITGRTVAALDGLRDRGMRLVVATGRRFEGAREHAGRLGFAGEDPVICYGGSMVRRMNGETLLHSTLPRDLGVEVLEWAAERELHARVFVDGRVITSPDTPATFRYLRRYEEPGLSAVEDPAVVEGWLREAQDAFRGRLFVTRSLPHYVEVGGLEGTKSKALRFLCEHWGIDPARTIAFGDADNDVDMLRFVGHGVAVGGMTDEVREAADAVAPPVYEDGVALYLEKFLGGL